MGMFTGATSFNQNLCAWKEKFPYGFESSTEIFDNTACTYDARPRQSNEFGGPFCASDCSPTESPTLKPTEVSTQVTTPAPTPPPPAPETTVPEPTLPTYEPTTTSPVAPPTPPDDTTSESEWVLAGSTPAPAPKNGNGGDDTTFSTLYGSSACMTSASMFVTVFIIGGTMVWTLAGFM